MNTELKEDFKIVEEGTQYLLRGSKLAGEEVPKREGTLHEHLLSAIIHDLQYKSKLVPSRETDIVITKMQEALQWLRQRQVDRVKRNVVGTYQK